MLTSMGFRSERTQQQRRGWGSGGGSWGLWSRPPWIEPHANAQLCIHFSSPCALNPNVSPPPVSARSRSAPRRAARLVVAEASSYSARIGGEAAPNDSTRHDLGRGIDRTPVGMRPVVREPLGAEMDRGDSTTRVVVLGSTGSIGLSTMNVIESDGSRRLRARPERPLELAATGRPGARGLAPVHHPHRSSAGRRGPLGNARYRRRGPDRRGRRRPDGAGPGDRPGAHRHRRRRRAERHLGRA